MSMGMPGMQMSREMGAMGPPPHMGGAQAQMGARGGPDDMQMRMMMEQGMQMGGQGGFNPMDMMPVEEQ